MPIPRSSRWLAPHMAQLAGAKANGAGEEAVSAHIPFSCRPDARTRRCASRKCVSAKVWIRIISVHTPGSDAREMRLDECHGFIRLNLLGKCLKGFGARWIAPRSFPDDRRRGSGQCLIQNYRFQFRTSKLQPRAVANNSQ